MHEPKLIYANTCIGRGNRNIQILLSCILEFMSSLEGNVEYIEDLKSKMKV